MTEREIIGRINQIDRLLAEKRECDALSRYNTGDLVHAKQLEFHKCDKRIRWVFGGNRTGKTECGAVETVWMARGIHPYRENRKNTEGWVVSLSRDVQREVAQRIAEPPGSKTYGILSVLLQAWYDIEYLFTVDEHVFNPPPKVKSGVIRLKRNNVTDLGCDERLFKTIVKTSFGQRRKTLRNSLRGLLPKDSPLLSEQIMAMRPEQLGIEEFVKLTALVADASAK